MKRALLVAALAGGVALTAVPSQAAGPVGGTCGTAKIQVACQEHPCTPDYPCNIEICLVWVGGCKL